MNDSFQVNASLGWMARLVSRYPRFWRGLGDLETAWLSDLDETKIHAPVYVCGLARAGSTLLLETLAAMPGVATHRWRDFPFLFTPYWWNKTLALNPLRDTARRERAHGDRMQVSPESPEAMEEMLWMAFFSDSHNPERSNALDGATVNSAFERFYRAHIRKILRLRGVRYVAKGNYNLTRMGYLLKIFPDARFLIPVREPVAHIGSLMRQHERFKSAGPQAAMQMSLAGHFEFGLNRIPIHTGEEARMREIRAAWQNGEEVRGWALYWDMLHRFIQQQQNLPALLVPFEKLCEQPRQWLAKITRHAQLDADAATLDALAARIRTPDYYIPSFTAQETALIRDITGKTAARFGFWE